MHLEEAKSKIVSSYGKLTNTTQISSAIITVLIDLFLSLFSKCAPQTTPEQFAKRMRDPGVWDMFVIRQTARKVCAQDGVSYARHGNEIIKALLDAAKETTEEECIELCHEIQNAPGGGEIVW